MDHPLMLLAEKAEHPLVPRRLDTKAIMTAMIASFASDEAPLARLIQKLAGK